MDVVPGRDKFGRPLEYDPKDTSKHAVIWNTVFKCAKKYGVNAFTGWGISDSLSWFPNIDCTMVNKNGEEKNFRGNLIKNKSNTILDYFSKTANKIKKIGKKKDAKMLPEDSQVIREKSSTKSNSRNAFLEGLRVSTKESALNIEKKEEESKQIGQDKKDGQSIDD